jgi:PBSX family phage terminase large subunit
MVLVGRRTAELAVPKIRDLFFRPDANGGARYIRSRYKVAYGGRGGGKSDGFASIAVALGSCSLVRMLCGRELQNSIRESVHRLLSDHIARLGLSGEYEILQAGIYGKKLWPGPDGVVNQRTEFIFAGLKNNTAAIKSMKGLTHVWIEEADKVTTRSLQDLIPTVREDDSELWITFNPNDEKDAVYKEFVTRERPGCRRVFINWDDNPYFPRVLDEERRYDLQRIQEAPDAVGRQQLQATYDHVWGGKCQKFPEGAFFSELSLLVNGQPVDPPKLVDGVFCIIDTAAKSGKKHDGVGVVYFSTTRLMGLAHPLTVLDWDIVQMDGALLENWLPGVFRRLEHFARLCNARAGSLGAYIEDASAGIVLLQQAAMRQWPATPIDSKLTMLGKVARAINNSGYVHAGDCKITREAYEKQMTYKGETRNHLLHQVTSFNATVDDQGEDDLLDCFTYGVAMGLGNQEGF